MRTLAGLLAFVSLLALAGCGGDDPLPPYADMQWRLRCNRMGGCTGYPMRDVYAFDGAEGNRVSCEIETRGATREFFFSAYGPMNQFGIQLRNASFTGTGGAVGGSCGVTVLEDGSNWIGTCGSSAPSAAQPCQITDFRIDPMMGVLGKIYCEGLQQQGVPENLRELTHATEATMPMSFNFQNCTGL